MLIDVGRPSYGYELRNRIEERFAPLGFGARNVYRDLDSLLADELIEAKGIKSIGTTSRGAPRVLYEPTAAGVVAFEEWICAPVSFDVPREPIHLKVMLARPEQLDHLLGLVEGQIQACMAQLRSLARPSSLEPLADAAMPWGEAARLLAGDAQARALQAHVGWLEAVVTVLVHRLDAEDR
jgi:DNA-binding PadR family transcriptional regulator